MTEDSELERLKAERLAEMRRNLSKPDEEPADPQRQQSPRDILVSVLGFRGLEVLENAESQFPREADIVVSQLAQLIRSGELRETLDGGKLLALFRAVGLGVRMQTRINVEQDGKFVSLTEAEQACGGEQG